MFVNRMKSGINMTTGGTTINAVLTAKNTSRPSQRIRAIEKAASAAAAVDITTDPNVRIALFLNQVRKVPPCTASPKFENDSGHGSPEGVAGDWTCGLNAGEDMEQT